MKKAIYSVFILSVILTTAILLSTPLNLSAQTKAVIGNVDYTVENDKLVVTYDILKAKSDEVFNIRLIVNTVTGKTYNPTSVTGDVGDNVTGGKGKKIYWDAIKDNVYISEEIYVEVKSIPRSPKPVTEAQVATEEAKTKPQPAASGDRNISKGGAIALSAIVPGLGIRKMKGGGSQALLALPVYGAAAAGVVFMVTSNSAYNKYKDATTADDRNSYYDKAKSQQNISKIMFISAGAIWAINMIWTIATPNRPNPKYSFAPTIDLNTGKPMVTFNYKF